jgi:hypothetical protein
MLLWAFAYGEKGKTFFAICKKGSFELVKLTL